MNNPVLDLLETSFDSYVSGEAIAQSLHMTRANVWKEIQKLKQRGYIIESVRNKGYALTSLNGNYAYTRLLKHLGEAAPKHVFLYDSIDSTNNAAKSYSEATPSERNALFIADQQTEGRGRLGRAFYSPSTSGVYMSILMTTPLSLQDSQLITIVAALAVHQVFHAHFNIDLSIKWLNDLYLGTRKVCGILTEGEIVLESNSYEYLVVGIGINVHEAVTIPKDIESVYGSILEATQTFDRNQIVADIYTAFMALIGTLPESRESVINRYKELSNVLGKTVEIVGKEGIYYEAIDIDQNGYLVLKSEDNREHHMYSGEVSIRAVAK